jgi:hypothetical protein
MMETFQTNPGMFVFGIVLIVVVGGYYAYYFGDMIGVPPEKGDAVVTGKTYNPPSQTYRQTYSGGRNYTQSYTVPETYVLSITLNGEPSVVIVEKSFYDHAKEGDHVSVTYHRGRFTHRLVVSSATK